MWATRYLFPSQAPSVIEAAILHGQAAIHDQVNAHCSANGVWETPQKAKCEILFLDRTVRGNTIPLPRTLIRWSQKPLPPCVHYTAYIPLYSSLPHSHLYMAPIHAPAYNLWICAVIASQLHSEASSCIIQSEVSSYGQRHSTSNQNMSTYL